MTAAKTTQVSRKAANPTSIAPTDSITTPNQACGGRCPPSTALACATSQGADPRMIG
ncbi:hypothetical protein [Comamonas endophytica]|uniref:Uncharacterized protein n=1 Tax=Comamonas endophytica TaxID=2949090 RepID=A0ABY6GFK2_9BURK|nr:MULTISPECIES: hypothetical protein [unclassified Acidovorax]MCD2514340.1 hypothetical protein [Acidovorax sp. D4N7]UYG53587.1 hypothetical protein M9799_19695 [Acidovorax sp. 5MLIR]UYG53633.1 hypothetical protein M9799_16960 [Acidovorax sp. 5MLIR]